MNFMRLYFFKKAVSYAKTVLTSLYKSFSHFKIKNNEVKTINFKNNKKHIDFFRIL